MPGVRTKLGGESSAPSYGYLRQKLQEVFIDTEHGVNAYHVVRNGVLWQVKAGIVNDPSAPWHEYDIEYRQKEERDGPWYESEMRDGDGRTVLGFAFAPEAGYQTAVYIPEQGTDICFRRANEAHYAGSLAIIESTMYSEAKSFAAALRFEELG